MYPHPPGAKPISFRTILILLVIAFTILAIIEEAEGSSRTQAPAPAAAGASSAEAEAARVRRYWTPARMASARPLDLVLGRGGRPSLSFGRPSPSAAASFLTVGTPEAPPHSVNGRIFIKVRGQHGFCSGTAINSPSRQLVLTAGHCVNAGAVYRGNLWYRNLLFVPAYTAGKAPFGAFPVRHDKVFAPRQWTNRSNPDFDVGAFLVHPNKGGAELADAVGGGATIALDLPRDQRFSTFGYPGNVKRMQGCRSGYIGDDPLTFPFAGPPTLGITCQWAPGASGGGWLIGDGTQINGLNAYLHLEDRSHTYGPYFSQETVGKLVEGL
jgi:hypothetical protein